MNNLFVLTLPMLVCVFWSLILFILCRWRKDSSKYLFSLVMSMYLLVFIGYVSFFYSEGDLILLYECVYIFALLSISPLVILFLEKIIIQKKHTLYSFYGFIPAVSMFFLSIVLYLLMSPEERDIYMKWIVGRNSAEIALGTIIFLQYQKLSFILFIVVAQICFTIYYGQVLINKYRERSVLGLNEALLNANVLRYRLLLYCFLLHLGQLALVDVLGVSYFEKRPMIMLANSIFSGGLIFIIGYLCYQVNVLYGLSNNANSFTSFSDLNDKSEKQNIRQELLALLEDESVFTKKGLKINDVAKMLCSNRTYISNVVNSEFNMNFTDLINEYRIEYVKKMLSRSENKNLSLTEVRIMSGFSSDSSFYRIFKQKEGITPLEYKKQYFKQRGRFLSEK